MAALAVRAHFAQKHVCGNINRAGHRLSNVWELFGVFMPSGAVAADVLYGAAHVASALWLPNPLTHASAAFTRLKSMPRFAANAGLGVHDGCEPHGRAAERQFE